MAGETYLTFMVDPLGALPPTLGYQVQSQLAALFSPVCSMDFENNWVIYNPSNPSAANPTGFQLLVYFMPAGLSIVKRSMPGTSPPAYDPDQWGLTSPSMGASEVYVNLYNPVMLAKIAFHELMHNRLNVDDKLHRHPMRGLAIKDITPVTELTLENIRAMRRVLRVPKTQWTAGIKILTEGAHDHMSEYYKG